MSETYELVDLEEELARLRARVKALEVALLETWLASDQYDDRFCQLCFAWALYEHDVKHKPDCIVLTLDKEPTQP